MRERERERGKGLEAYGTSDLFYTSSSGLPCKKHPSSSPIGVCAYCLRDRLLRLVCSDCGEQRLSSCSCSEIDTDNNRTSCVGSVGRMSFLIENEKNPEAEEVVLKRSSSSCAGIKKTGGLWKIGRLFKKKSSTEKSEMWVVDDCNGGVSRSRSLCSFRGANLYDDYLPVSAARSSVSAARSSGVNVGMALDSGRRSGFSEAEPRRSGYGYNSEAEQQRKSSYSEAEPRKSSFSYNSEAETRKSNFDDQERKPEPNRRIFSLRETDFSSDSGFIDLKFDFSNNPEQQGVALSAFGSMRSGGDENEGIGAGERGIKRSRKSFKGWGWIFKNHPNSTNARKKDLHHDVTFNPSYR